jgi:hypothetical protein
MQYCPDVCRHEREREREEGGGRERENDLAMRKVERAATRRGGASPSGLLLPALTKLNRRSRCVHRGGFDLVHPRAPA